MYRTVGLAALIILLTTQDTAKAAGPAPGDVVLTWTTAPKKVAPNLTMAGKVEFKNGWSSANGGKVVVTITPTGGGGVVFSVATLAADGTWSVNVPLNTFPNPAKDYDIIASVQAWTGNGTTAYPVAGDRKTLSLP